MRAIIENLKNESGDFTVLDVIIRLTLGLEDAENGCCFECGRDKLWRERLSCYISRRKEMIRCSRKPCKGTLMTKEYIVLDGTLFWSLGSEIVCTMCGRGER